MIIYSKSAGYANAAIGRLETPIKMIIEHESDLLTKKGGICSWLFNVEKSSRFGETLVSQNEFDVFQAASEGAGAELDTITETSSKFIEHIQFMKEFIISAEMMEDASYGVASEAKRRAENFARAYHKTINKLCATALACGNRKSMIFAKGEVDLTTSDSLPLFSASHKWGSTTNGGTQSNYFYGDIFGTTVDGKRKYSVDVFEEGLAKLAYKIRNMKDENGEPLGYTADTIILPGNHPEIEMIVKKVCGSINTAGSSYNDINLHYGNWNIIMLPTWTTWQKSIIVMSSEANKNLSGNMFFNRVPLTVTNWVDNHTGNYIWNGRCRFGIGFGSYKHIVLGLDTSDNSSNSASEL